MILFVMNMTKLAQKLRIEEATAAEERDCQLLPQ